MKILKYLLAITIIITMSGILFLNQNKFGRKPTGERLERIEKSPNYKDGSFQNQSFTPDLTEGATYFSVMREFIFGKSERSKPLDVLPSKKTDLKNLDKTQDIMVWFGHSSYFMQLGGKTILVDPVFSGAASPVSFTTKAFKGSDQYTTEELPEIDYLFISHDHWDHLDYETVIKLKSKVKKVICGLGTGEHLEYWGYNKDHIIEMDWYEKFDLDPGFVVHSVPARHFSGRGLTRNKALWSSFVLQANGLQIFIGGDSGYDKHFAEAGDKFGGFDLAIIENGQYNKSWKHIHLLPEEILKAATDLKAKRLFPVHSSKFVLGNHAWDEPLELIMENNKSVHMDIITPMIGEQVNLGDSTQKFTMWWKDVK